MSIPKYPVPRFYFSVKWGENEPEIQFTEVTGLLVETELIEYRHGNSPSFHKIKMPGMQKYGNITLKRGVFIGENSFYDAWNSVLGKPTGGEDFRKELLITLKDENGVAVVAWNVFRAFAVKVTSPDLKSDANEAAIETIELAHEGITIANPPAGS
jgi:phage tail-like protein